jgi:hypothetical protein
LAWVVRGRVKERFGSAKFSCTVLKRAPATIPDANAFAERIDDDVASVIGCYDLTVR